jgi:hypothetical protein
LAAPSHSPLDAHRARVLRMPHRPSRRWRWIAGTFFVLVVVFFVAAAICIRVVISRAQPILRARVIETLSTRFKSRVELSDLRVRIDNGVRVDGVGLKIFGATDPNPSEAGVQPLLAIDAFHFQAGLRGLFHAPMKVDTIYVSGLTMNIPPKEDRLQVSNFRKHSGRMSIEVGSFVCSEAKLLINTSTRGKLPLQFDIKDLVMKDVGPDKPLRFSATLVNPKPVGDIQSSGLFGPLNEESPRDSPVAGSYSFTNADLGTLKGIGGILSSTGTYSGKLGLIEVEGETDTPDFRIAVSGHRVPLRTNFHAMVDGTDGDTYLQPVNVKVLHSSFSARGRVVRMKNAIGHDIELDVVLDRANIEDLLRLGVKTDPPIMGGHISMKTHLSLQPGEEDIANRLELGGQFHIPNGSFTNEKIQNRIDSLSLRSRGQPGAARENRDAPVTSDLQGTFALREGVLSFSFLHFQIPGTHADMAGQYSLDGNTFDFHGTLKLDAKLSQMMTGWKSILLKPVDPFFSKHGAGTEIPFKINGTRDEPHFGLDLFHKEERPHSERGQANAAR